MQTKWTKRWSRELKIQKALDYSKAIGQPFADMFGCAMHNWLYLQDVLGLMEQREWMGAVSTAKGSYRLLKEDELKLFTEDINAPLKIGKGDNIEIKEVKGMVANKGIVRGKVKIILSSADFHKFEDGDIIVTSMTSVDFVPLMKRAGAFVTNEGGITSHAAIVSRELDKPCIIGTQNATKILKDDDLVEVNANEGIVKILR
jgi:phosphoenolpyruvate synthase/pyruvate phosphate dikinase